MGTPGGPIKNDTGDQSLPYIYPAAGYEYGPNLVMTTMAALALRKTTKKGNNIWWRRWGWDDHDELTIWMPRNFL